ncbi:MAG: PKD domain-containing protein [Bacteroidales bacterium]|nr:PKD domain-containing protein [Bacteroidales bacterium]
MDTVHFTNLTTNNPEWWHWEFEGGIPAVSSEQNPIVVYPYHGEYDVKLTAGNSYGSDSIFAGDYIKVLDITPVTGFTSSGQNPGIADTVWFYDNSGNYIQWWYWEFPGGDPPVSFEKNPLVKYCQPGYHDIVHASGNSNGSDTIIMQAYIHAYAMFYVNIRVFPEGPYNGVNLTNSLNTYNYLPLYQPYTNYPWFYPGTEQVSVIPFPNVVDWVLLEFRGCCGGPENATPQKIMKRQAAFLMKNGFICDLDGVSNILFNLDTLLNVYVTVYHRNHLPVMSAYPITKIHNTCDFTVSSSKAYGGCLAQKELAPGIWGLISGNANGDGAVNNQDKVDFWMSQAGNSGYWAGDMDMNGNVDNADKVDCWMPNVGAGCQVPE